ncbi:MAG: hypothetical protein ACXAE3_10115 [Candidatus Kariarchaeaceae archaeon]|jgi:hypothetical protein
MDLYNYLSSDVAMNLTLGLIVEHVSDFLFEEYEIPRLKKFEGKNYAQDPKPKRSEQHCRIENTSNSCSTAHDSSTVFNNKKYFLISVNQGEPLSNQNPITVNKIARSPILKMKRSRLGPEYFGVKRIAKERMKMPRRREKSASITLREVGGNMTRIDMPNRRQITEVSLN